MGVSAADMRLRLGIVTIVFASPIVMVSQCTDVCQAGTKEDGDKPGVFALVIGVSKYHQYEPELVHANRQARKFAKHVRDTYPNATMWERYDDDATQEEVRKILFRKIPNVPPDSLVIIYYAGHGQRVEYPSRHIKSDLFLRLHGSTFREFVGDAVRLDEVLASIYRTRRVTVMAFLDCCFSGRDYRTIQVPEEVFRRIDTRAFMLTSSDRAEPSQGGIFTDALLQVWKDTLERHDYLTPRRLEKLVRIKVQNMSEGMMLPKLAFGDGIARSIGALHERACLLVLRFPYGCKYPCEIRFDGQVDHEFYTWSEDEIVFRRQISRDARKLEIISEGDTIFTHSFGDDELRDVTALSIEVAPRFRSQQELAIETLQQASLECAEAAEWYGADAAPFYFDTAALKNFANPGVDVSPLLTKAADAAEGAGIYKWAAMPWLDDEVVGEILAQDDPSEVASALQAVGRYKSAARVWTAVSERTDSEQDEDFYQFQAYACSTVAGDYEAARGLYASLESSPSLNAKQRAFFESVPMHQMEIRDSPAVLFIPGVEAWRNVSSESRLDELFLRSLLDRPKLWSWGSWVAHRTDEDNTAAP